MEKVIRDGNVAVLYSPGFGAGWELVSVTKTSKGYRYTFKRPY